MMKLLHLLTYAFLSRLAKEVTSDAAFPLVHGQQSLLGEKGGANSNCSPSISQLGINYIIPLVFIRKALTLYKRV